MSKEDTIEVFITIPKGDTRRRHLDYNTKGYEKRNLIDMGRIKDSIPVNDGVMPIAYGCIMDTLQKDETKKNPSEVPDEVDVLVYSYHNFDIAEKGQAISIALITREDGDHKVVAVDSTTSKQIKRWEDIPSSERDLIIRYFGYKSPIKSIEGAKVAIEYVNKNRVKTKSKSK